MNLTTANHLWMFPAWFEAGWWNVSYPNKEDNNTDSTYNCTREQVSHHCTVHACCTYCVVGVCVCVCVCVQYGYMYCVVILCVCVLDATSSEEFSVSRLAQFWSGRKCHNCQWNGEHSLQHLFMYIV